MSLRITPLSPQAEPLLSPDLIWDGVTGDFAPAADDEVGNRGGLRARAHLATAVLICLMTDIRVDPVELRDGDVNKGWPGDAFDVDVQQHERPLGSKLWLLRRHVVDDVKVPRLAADYARQALQVLIDQGAVARVDVSAEGDPARNLLTLDVQLYGRDGASVYHEKYQVLWEQVRNGPQTPLAE